MLSRMVGSTIFSRFTGAATTGASSEHKERGPEVGAVQSPLFLVPPVLQRRETQTATRSTDPRLQPGALPLDPVPRKDKSDAPTIGRGRSSTADHATPRSDGDEDDEEDYEDGDGDGEEEEEDDDEEEEDEEEEDEEEEEEDEEDDDDEEEEEDNEDDEGEEENLETN